TMWLIYYIAPLHFCVDVCQHLNIFPGRWIGRGGHVAWPVKSPDLNPPVWHLKVVVYAARVSGVQRQPTMWLTHDRAPFHFYDDIRHYLNIFPGRWISRGGHVAWPVRSPN
ncbi:hypothetical protein ANN_00517, partial [Periplaneta americana]